MKSHVNTILKKQMVVLNSKDMPSWRKYFPLFIDLWEVSRSSIHLQTIIGVTLQNSAQKTNEQKKQNNISYMTYSINVEKLTSSPLMWIVYVQGSGVQH